MTSTFAPRSDELTTAAGAPPVAAPGGGAVPVLVAVAVAGLLGAATATGGVLVVAALVGAAAVAVVAVRPVIGAYALIGLTPLVVGIDRGVLLPLMRPNEALLLVVVAGLVVRGVVAVARGARLEVRPERIELAMVAMAVASSVVPLLWMVARGSEVVLDDLLYAVTLWKYLALYLVVRIAVSTEPEVRRCLWLSLGAGVVVAVVGVLQSLQLFGVPGLLATWYTPGDDEYLLFINRGTSTIAQSISVGDVMTFDLAIALTMLLLGVERRRWLLIGMSVVFVLGALATGQLSAVIGLCVGALVVAVLCQRMAQVLSGGVLVAAAGAALLAPVLQTRLAGVDPSQGIPQSWIVRLENLQEHFWPQVFDGANWLLGVRTSARVPAPEVWRDFVYIESGHTWLLWNGGIPLLVAFLAFWWIAVTRTAAVARARRDAVGVAAVAACAALWVVFVLMLLDPHLTMRGSADLLFPLVALALCGRRRAPAPAPTPTPTPTPTTPGGPPP